MLRNHRHRARLRLVLPLALLGLAGAAQAAEALPPPGSPPRCGGPAAEAASAPAMVACDSGGVGATSCETKVTISVSGFGTTSSCGISCTTGFYACCQNPGGGHDAKCVCLTEHPEEPFTPVRAW
ncbi:MAG TPA: hypothetical protein VFV19_00725 [Candidatus Polarisedimenticolaceae bacterium]|nr:hypothetical protein [Candidatus Polarisedimenticolaceae bacterium]